MANSLVGHCRKHSRWLKRCGSTCCMWQTRWWGNPRNKHHATAVTDQQAATVWAANKSSEKQQASLLQAAPHAGQLGISQAQLAQRYPTLSSCHTRPQTKRDCTATAVASPLGNLWRKAGLLFNMWAPVFTQAAASTLYGIYGLAVLGPTVCLPPEGGLGAAFPLCLVAF
jgi:hypothetical protein